MAKVCMLKCQDYSYNNVYEAVVQSFASLGGIEEYISPGDRVLLKVNMLAKRKPEDATTTHPVFVQALAQYLIDFGASVVIGDSPGGPFIEAAVSGMYKTCGFEGAAAQTGAVLNKNFNSVTVKNPDGLKLKLLTVTDMLNDVDKVISVSKFKTHALATFTGAVKNMFGIVPGLLKGEYHLNMPGIKDFSDALVDICLYAKPILSFMDAIIGMEGDGPSAGTPRKVGAVIASDSPYHLDVAASWIIGLRPEHVPTIQRCVERGIVAGDLSDISLSGDSIDSFVINDFKMPEQGTSAFDRAYAMLPGFIGSLLNRHFKPRPQFIHSKCIGCGICKKSCPPRAIRTKQKMPYVNLDTCIRCYCCQELCPRKAVKIFVPTINKILFRRTWSGLDKD